MKLAPKIPQLIRFCARVVCNGLGVVREEYRVHYFRYGVKANLVTAPAKVWC